MLSYICPWKTIKYFNASVSSTRLNLIQGVCIEWLKQILDELMNILLNLFPEDFFFDSGLFDSPVFFALKSRGLLKSPDFLNHESKEARELRKTVGKTIASKLSKEKEPPSDQDLLLLLELHQEQASKQATKVLNQNFSPSPLQRGRTTEH